ncbi:MAG TPA: transglycosylase domain-containing protein, partial [Patescibacteria group bacterium]
NSLQQEQFPQTTKIYDRNHHLLYQFYANQNRTIIHLSDVPKYLKEATIATEDKNFYSNPGFDLIAIIRAAIIDSQGGKIQGGSTITQQLIKSAFLTSEQSIGRKLEELVLAFWTEHVYTKDQILEMYFNLVPYGGTAWGVEAASQTYFGQHVKDLDLAQSAFLAGLPQAPTRYSPYATSNLWKNRQKEVLSHMRDLGYITKAQYSDALSENLNFQSPETPLLAPHFVMYIKDLLIQKYGLPMVEKGGLSVTTSLDLSVEQKTEKIIADEVQKDNYLNLTNGAAVVSDPKNGDILAMIGSADYNNPDWGNVNIPTSLRQPGSSIKIVTYATAFTKGFTAASRIEDEPVSFPGAVYAYSPVNYDGAFHGWVSLRQALANSFNIPAVKLVNAVGVDSFVDMGKKLGIESLKSADNYGLSVTLGSPEVTMLDMATAYSTIANLGKRINLNPLLKVTDSRGNVLEQKSVSSQKVLDPGVAFILSDILSDNNARSWEFGPNSPLKIDGHRVSVKTGTTDNKRDNWTIGYTPNYVVTVWVGNNDNSPMSQTLASGITGAAPIWHQIMSSLLGNSKDAPLVIPSDIVSKTCSGHTEYFIKGTENSVNCANIFPTWTPTPSPN